MTSNVLYKAQASAGEVFQTQWLPCYREDYTDSGALWCYGKAYNGIRAVSDGIEWVRAGAAGIIGGTVEAILKPLLDLVYPINPINNTRHFLGIPRSLEKTLGDWVFYPLATRGMRSTFELLPGTNTSIESIVNAVLKDLKTNNDNLLNPAGEAEFDYRMKTIHSSQINAFATPGGGMVVFTQIVKEIDAAIKSGSIKETTVEFADGSKVTVDLSGVALKDVLAALLGHEMTHIASRHSIVAIFGNLIRSVLLSVGRVCFVAYLKSFDSEYRELMLKPYSQLDHTEQSALKSKEELYDQLNDAFEWVEGQLKKLAGLFHSRKNEYEADVTGAYFSQQAGFNPLGALYLQEVLGHGKDSISDKMHKYLEFLYTHPYSENRKRALFAAINEINSKQLKGRTHWEIADHRYDFDRSRPGISYASRLSQNP